MPDHHEPIRVAYADLYSTTRTGFVAAENRPRTYGPGRVCSEEGCGTILSVYNGGTVCAAQSGPEAPSGPERTGAAAGRTVASLRSRRRLAALAHSRGA
jgi:hypothetical protein